MPQEYHCDGCGRDFAIRTTTARIARVFLIIFGIAFALYVVLAIAAVIFSHSS